MKNAGHLAAVYSQAIFELAGEAGIADTVKHDFDLFANIMGQEKDFVKMIDSPYFTADYKSRLVEKTFSGRLADLTVDFLLVVIKRGRTPFLPAIIAAYSELWDAHNGNCRVKVTVPMVMDSGEAAELADKIAAAINRRVKLELAVDSSVMGGVIIRYGDKIIDNTVKSRLRKAIKAVTNQGRRQGKIDEI